MVVRKVGAWGQIRKCLPHSELRASQHAHLGRPLRVVRSLQASGGLAQGDGIRCWIGQAREARQKREGGGLFVKGGLQGLGEAKCRPGVVLDAGMDEVIAGIGTSLLARHVHL